MTKKPKTIEEWVQVCHNLNAALQLSMRDEDELIKELEKEKADNKLLKSRIKKMDIALAKSAGIINYLEMKLERAHSV